MTLRTALSIASAAVATANFPLSQVNLKSEEATEQFFAKHMKSLGIIPTKTMETSAKRHRYLRQNLQLSEAEARKQSTLRPEHLTPLGKAMQTQMMKQLETMHTEFYDDKSCEEAMYSPITEDNKDGEWRFFMFFHGMGGAPCQIRLLKDTVFAGFKNNRVKLTTAVGDHMSKVSNSFIYRYTDEGLEGRARLIADSVMNLVAEAKANATEAQPQKKVGLFVSSNGMLDFLHSWKHLYDKGIDDDIFIYWVAAMDDKVNTESGGAAAKFAMANMDKMFACTKEPVYNLTECFIPVGGVFEYVNPELALHFKGVRKVYDAESKSYKMIPFMYRKEDIEHRLYWKGRYYSSTYDPAWYNERMHYTTKFLRDHPEFKIKSETCTIAATKDGYWQVNQPGLEAMMDKYFDKGYERNIMMKDTSHLWVINSGIMEEFIEFCNSHGKVTFDKKKIYGQVADWHAGGLGNGAPQKEMTAEGKADKHQKHAEKKQKQKKGLKHKKQHQ